MELLIEQFVIPSLENLGLVPSQLIPLLLFFLAVGFYINKSWIKPLSTKIGAVESNLALVNNAVAEIQKNTKYRWKVEPQFPLEMRPKWSEAKSPIVLNERGWRLLEASGTKQIIEAHLEKLIKELETTSPKTAYDVQNNAYIVFGNLVVNEQAIQDSFKNFVYNNPKFEGLDIELNDIVYVGAIELRNKYLKRHPELRNTPHEPQEKPQSE